MRRLALLTILGGAAFLLFGAAPAFADAGPHISTAGTVTDRCAGCHRLHSAQAPLLLKVDAGDICVTCHGAAAGGSALDVLNGLGYDNSARGAAVGALRGGGFEFALVDSGAGGVDFGTTATDGSRYALTSASVGVLALNSGEGATSTHSVDESAQTAWGGGAFSGTANPGTANVALTCTSCHDPHGNGNYRILRPIPEQSGATTDVVVADVTGTARDYDTSDYWSDLADTGIARTPGGNSSPYSTFLATVSSWCSQCHTRYLAVSGQTYNFDTGDAIFRYRHRSNSASRVQEGTIVPPGTVPNIAGVYKSSPSCVQCHLSHGSNSATGTESSLLENPGGGTVGLGVGASPASADNRLLRIDERGICQVCHKK